MFDPRNSHANYGLGVVFELHLGADIAAEGGHQIVEDLDGHLAGIDPAGDRRGHACLLRASEQLDVAQRFVEERQLLRAAPRACAHELPPSFGQRHHARLTAPRVDRAPDAEQPSKELPDNQQSSAK